VCIRTHGYMGHTLEKRMCGYRRRQVVDGLEIFENLKATPEGGLPETLTKFLRG
jgi:hypothetical protein